MLIVLRLLWRMTHSPPALAPQVPPWPVRAANIAHASIYMLLLLMPISGYLGASFGGEGVAWFGIPVPTWTTKDDGLKEFFFGAHSAIAWALIALVTLHILGALKHHFRDKDGLLRRMWGLHYALLNLTSLAFDPLTFVRGVLDLLGISS